MDVKWLLLHTLRHLWWDGNRSRPNPNIRIENIDMKYNMKVEASIENNCIILTIASLLLNVVLSIFSLLFYSTCL